MRRLVVLLIVLVVLFVGADRLAWKLAENEVANRIQSSENLDQKPDVAIGGFPFLTQVVNGRYKKVNASIDDLSVDRGVTIDQVKVALAGLHVPLKSLINRDLQTVPVDSGSTTGEISWASLDAAAKANLPTDAVEIHFAEGKSGPNQVALTGTYKAAGLSAQITGDATVYAQDGQLVITVNENSINLPVTVRTQIAKLLGTTYKLPRLPLGLRVSKINVSPTGVAVTAIGKNLVLGSSGLG